MSRDARRLLQRQQLGVEDSSSSSSSSSSSKKVLLDVATKAHKEQLMRVIRGKQKRQETEERRKVTLNPKP